jgi:hypothetical protein
MQHIKLFEQFVNEAQEIKTYMFYNMTPETDTWGSPVEFQPRKPSFFADVAKYLGIGKNYIVGIAEVESTKGIKYTTQVFITGDVDTGDDKKYIGNTKYAPDGIWQGNGTPSEKPKGWDFVDNNKPLMIVNGVEIYIAKVGKVG